MLLSQPFDGKKFKPVMKRGLDVDNENDKKKLAEIHAEFEPLNKFMKEFFGEKSRSASGWPIRRLSTHNF